MLKIRYVADNPDRKRGSYRIWVHDAITKLQELGYDCDLAHTSDLPALADVDGMAVIVDKADLHKVSSFTDRKSVFGAINPPTGIGENFDFAIVGSIEERISLSKDFSFIFLSPLIEAAFSCIDAGPRNHSGNIKLAYHGNSLHLSAMRSSGLSRAIEEFAQLQERQGNLVSLHVITETVSPKWIWGRPDIQTSFYSYDINTIASVLSSCDIGVVPNAHSRVPGLLSSILLRKIFRMDAHRSDYILRFKSKSNFGRAMVFMQMGVPVVADLTPSHLDLIEDRRTGFIAFNKDSWLDAFVMLADQNTRRSVAFAARTMIDQRFPLEKNCRDLLDFLTHVADCKKRIAG